MSRVTVFLALAAAAAAATTAFVFRLTTSPLNTAHCTLLPTRHDIKERHGLDLTFGLAVVLVRVQ
jgi:hypothetical protein